VLALDEGFAEASRKLRRKELQNPIAFFNVIFEAHSAPLFLGRLNDSLYLLKGFAIHQQANIRLLVEPLPPKFYAQNQHFHDF
jgi:hypothetical protein